MFNNYFTSLVLLAAVLTGGLAAQQGSLVAWGNDNYGEVSGLPPGDNFVDADTQFFHCVALKSDGTLVSWGWDVYSVVSLTPAGNDFVQVTCGGTHAAAIRADGSIDAWGLDDEGQGSDPPGTDYVKVVAGRAHNLALRADGSLYSWGMNTTGSVTATPTGNDFVDIAAGRFCSLALRQDGSIEAWGYDAQGQVSGAPAGTGYSWISSGHSTSIAIRADGSLEAWGNPAAGIITNLPSGNDFVQVDLGADGGTALALRVDGSLVAWGDSPGMSVPPGTGFLQVATNAGYFLARREGSDPPILSLGTVQEGQPAEVTVWNCAPGATVLVAVSVHGAGPTSVPMGTLALTPPLQILPSAVADASGIAVVQAIAPFGMAGRTVWVQSAEVGRNLLSNGASAVVQVFPIPVVDAVVPDQALQGQVVGMTVQGHRFLQGAEIELVSATQTIPLQDEWFLHATLIGGTADLTGAPVGLYTVRVINPGGLQGELPDGFEVLP